VAEMKAAMKKPATPKTAAKKPVERKVAPKVEQKPEATVLMSDHRSKTMNVTVSKVEEFKSKGYKVV